MRKWEISNEVIDDLAGFFNLPREDILLKFKKTEDLPGYVKFANLTNQLWLLSDIQNRSDDISIFYQNNIVFLFDLVELYNTPHRRGLSRFILSFLLLNQWEVKSVLDYGCGAGDDAILYSKIDNIKITIADIPSIALEFAKYRINKKGLNINVVPLNNEIPEYNGENVALGKYDVITCLDVFEHVFNPIDTLEKILSYLNPKGYLIYTARFANQWGDREYYPHLPHNNDYNNGKWEKIIKNKKMTHILSHRLYGKQESAKYVHIFRKAK